MSFPVKRNFRIRLCAVLLALVAGAAYGQEAAVQNEIPVQNETTVPEEMTVPTEMIVPAEIYLLPQTVYVGDRARLVVGLGPAFTDAPAFVRTAADDLPLVSNLEISRVELEKRNNRLLIDFTAYAPGEFVLPALIVPLGASENGKTLSLVNIRFNVASILTPATMTLADPALPLPAPGTGFYVYGGIAALLALFILVIAALFSFSRFAGPLRKRFRKRKLLASIEQKMALLRGNSLDNDIRARNETFALLSAEFREFLTFITGVNCEALTPGEFTMFPAALPGVSAPAFLGSLYRRWDDLRFSGSPSGRSEQLAIVDELAVFFEGLHKAEKSA